MLPSDDLKHFLWCTATHIFQTKLIHRNWKYLQNLMFTGIEGLTDMPLLVLGHTVGVTGHRHTTHGYQHIGNFLGTLQ
jgi:hypothetical protein